MIIWIPRDTYSKDSFRVSQGTEVFPRHDCTVCINDTVSVSIFRSLVMISDPLFVSDCIVLYRNLIVRPYIAYIGHYQILCEILKTGLQIQVNKI